MVATVLVVMTVVIVAERLVVIGFVPVVAEFVVSEVVASLVVNVKLEHVGHPWQFVQAHLPAHPCTFELHIGLQFAKVLVMVKVAASGEHSMQASHPSHPHFMCHGFVFPAQN